MNVKFEKSVKERFSLMRGLSSQDIIPENERFNYSVKDLSKGDFLQYRQKTFQVQAVDRYQEIDDRKRYIGDPWYELKLFRLDDGEILYLEWEEDDNIRAWITYERDKIRLRDILTKSLDPVNPNSDTYDLDDIVDEEDHVIVDGTKYRYEDDYGCLYFRDGKGDGLEVYMYEFESKSGKGVSIEEWKDGENRCSYECWKYAEVNPDEFVIISKGG